VADALAPSTVIHFVDAMGTTRLWGKERAIAALMDAQRRDGVSARLVTFTPNALVETIRAAGFRADVLEDRHRRIPFVAVRRLAALLHEEKDAVLHTHGYKADITGRLARLAGAPMACLVSTVHGMNDENLILALYHRIDRLTASLSDVVAIADVSLLEHFAWPDGATFVGNAVPERPAFTAAERADARRRLGIVDDRVVVGLLGRVSAAKGALEALEAARSCPDALFLFAGEGSIADGIRAGRDRLPNVGVVGYVDDADAFLAALDIYLQASHTEAMSLALLEAMRGGLPCVATRVGSTAVALADAGILIRAGDATAIQIAIEQLASQPALRARLGAAARARYAAAFSVEPQHRRYLELYRTGCAKRAAAAARAPNGVAHIRPKSTQR
jgi:glycosyltransferase involved in cell wall biosynthesis